MTITAAWNACWPTAKMSRWNSTSSTTSFPRARRAITWSPRFRARTRLSPLRLRRHGGRAASTALRWAEGKPSAPDHWHLDGLHALVGMGRNLSRLYGRDDAAGVLASADRRAQSHDAQDGHGCNSPGPGVGERRIQIASARLEDRARRAAGHGQQPAADAEAVSQIGRASCRERV